MRQKDGNVTANATASPRRPKYHIAQLAPSLEQWMTLHWPDMLENIEKTRRNVVKIELAWKDEFELAINKAKERHAQQQMKTETSVRVRLQAFGSGVLHALHHWRRWPGIRYSFYSSATS